MSQRKCLFLHSRINSDLELGMNYAVISDSLIVGSLPQKPEDVDHLKDEEKVAYVLCLQQDKDFEYWGVDFKLLSVGAKNTALNTSEDRELLIYQAVDIDPDSLRKQLPKAVSALEWAISQGKGQVYAHCTAGLGTWESACGCNCSHILVRVYGSYDKLTSKRPCGPNKGAICAASYDLSKNDPWKEPFESLPENAFEDISNWERKLIQDRVRALREAREGK